jgi:CheY-like chemotaxis protein
MSHEIRTPLNGIVGSLNLLKESKGLNEEQEEFINIINYSSDSLLRIINDILDFSKIEAGKMLSENITFSLHDLIKSIQYIFVPIAENEKMIEFLAPIPNYQGNFKGDPGKIRQVLINLINNALKFTSEGYVLLNTQIKEIDQKTTLVFEVEDSGTGIPQENADKIFESFTQEDSSTTRKYGGTGLGLSISKKLSAIMGGDLTVKSELGKGSTFTATMVVEKTDEVLKQHKECTTSTFTGDILLVEDNLINRTIATKVLTRMNLNVHIAENGQEAIDKCVENKYDLIFMDLMMPVLDGISATKELKKQKLKTPIIAMTASAFEEDKRKCYQVGMDGFISKPISKQEIINCLSKFLTKA